MHPHHDMDGKFTCLNCTEKDGSMIDFYVYNYTYHYPTNGADRKDFVVDTTFVKDFCEIFPIQNCLYIPLQVGLITLQTYQSIMSQAFDFGVE